MVVAAAVMVVAVVVVAVAVVARSNAKFYPGVVPPLITQRCKKTFF